MLWDSGISSVMMKYEEIGKTYNGEGSYLEQLKLTLRHERVGSKQD